MRSSFSKSDFKVSDRTIEFSPDRFLPKDHETIFEIVDVFSDFVLAQKSNSPIRGISVNSDWKTNLVHKLTQNRKEK